MGIAVIVITRAACSPSPRVVYANHAALQRYEKRPQVWNARGHYAQTLRHLSTEEDGPPRKRNVGRGALDIEELGGEGRNYTAVLVACCFHIKTYMMRTANKALMLSFLRFVM